MRILLQSSCNGIVPVVDGLHRTLTTIRKISLLKGAAERLQSCATFAMSSIFPLASES